MVGHGMPGAVPHLDNALVADDRPVPGRLLALAGVRRAGVVAGTRLVLLLFVVLQGFDGLFTYVAVNALGIGVEGNRLLASVMASLGPLPALVVAKSVAAAAGLLLYARGWHATLATVTAFYALAAIGPWLVVYVTWGQL
jgi:hypothetical protein